MFKYVLSTFSYFARASIASALIFSLYGHQLMHKQICKLLCSSTSLLMAQPKAGEANEKSREGDDCAVCRFLSLRRVAKSDLNSTDAYFATKN